MKYKINKNIIYNVDDCSILHLSTQEQLSLSITAGRLLEYLLTSKGEVLSREVLLTEIWDKYSLRGSNSNLNQYLSILRRTLSAFGCDDFIITIPKIGIRINTDIEIEVESEIVQKNATNMMVDTATSAPQLELPVSSPDTIPSENKERRLVHIDRKEKIILGLLAILLIAAGSVLYYQLKTNEDYRLPISTITFGKGCEVNLVKDDGILERALLDESIKRMLKDNNVPCDATHRIFYDDSTSFLRNNNDRTLLSVCELNNSGHITSCDNFYYVDRRVN